MSVPQETGSGLVWLHALCSGMPQLHHDSSETWGRSGQGVVYIHVMASCTVC